MMVILLRYDNVVFVLHNATVFLLPSILLVALFFVQPLLALALALVDYVAHWNIDFCKHRINNALGKTRKDKLFWWINSIDQGLHMLTYYLLVLYV